MDRIDPAPQRPEHLEPRPCTVTDTPATVERCAQDYANGGAVRANLGKQPAPFIR